MGYGKGRWYYPRRGGKQEGRAEGVKQGADEQEIQTCISNSKSEFTVSCIDCIVYSQWTEEILKRKTE